MKNTHLTLIWFMILCLAAGRAGAQIPVTIIMPVEKGKTRTEKPYTLQKPSAVPHVQNPGGAKAADNKPEAASAGTHKGYTEYVNREVPAQSGDSAGPEMLYQKKSDTNYTFPGVEGI